MKFERTIADMQHHIIYILYTCVECNRMPKFLGGRTQQVVITKMKDMLLQSRFPPVLILTIEGIKVCGVWMSVGV